MHDRSIVLFAVAAACAALACLIPAAKAEPATSPMQAATWRTLEPGLELGAFTAFMPSTVGDSTVTVLRIDPTVFSLKLLSQKHLGLPQPLTINEWVREHKLVAAINAGMFKPDGGTVGYSRVESTTLNPRRKANYGAYLALDPKDPAAKLPAAAILDGECEDVSRLEGQYRQVLQSMRMISCRGANLWRQSPRIWSTAALAIDSNGKVLFIIARSPWDVHDFIKILQRLPLGIARAMYLEGGPEASLAVAAGDVNLTRVGSFETGFNENDDNAHAWALPNVIGVRRIAGED